MIYAIHGFTGDASSFAAMDCKALTVLGHGADAHATAVVPFNNEVDRLAAKLPDDVPVHLVGYSLGGRLALAIALRHPRRVERLSLIGASPGIADEGERSQRRQADARWSQLLRERGIVAFVDAWQDLPLWHSQGRLPAERQHEQRERRLAHDPQQLALAMDSLGTGAMPNLWPALGELRVPVLLIVGALDRKYQEIAKDMAEGLPLATLAQVPECGHNPIFEAPEQARKLLREFA